MTTGSFSLTFDQICRRAGGRRRYNLARQRAAEERRGRVEEALNLLSSQNPTREWREQMARQFGVTRSTINRDVALLGLLKEFLALSHARQVKLMRRFGLF